MSSTHRVTVHHLSGDRFAIHIRGHRMVVDQPHPLAPAEEAGPSPSELMVGALAACTAHFAQRVLSRNGEGRSVAVICDYRMSDESPHRVAKVDIMVALPDGVPESRRAAILRAAQHCTVHETLLQPPAMSVSLVTNAGETLPTVRAENADAAAILEAAGRE